MFQECAQSISHILPSYGSFVKIFLGPKNHKNALFYSLCKQINLTNSGAIKNMSGSYDMSFNVMGSLMVLSGVIGLPLRRLNAWEKKRMMEESKHSVEMQPLNKDS